MTTPARPDQPPKGRGARYWGVAVLISVAGLVVVYVLYDRGILPLAGPFALLALTPVLLPLYERGQRAKAEREARRRDRARARPGR